MQAQVMTFLSLAAKLFNQTGVYTTSEVRVEHDQDTQLMLKFQSGDDYSFEILFRKYSASLINFVYRFLGSHAKAEEVAQEVLLKIYMSRKSYYPKAKFSTWAYRITTNINLVKGRDISNIRRSQR